MRFSGRAFAFSILTLLATSLIPVGTFAATTEEAPCPQVREVSSLLQPHDPGYNEALEFGQFLQKHHINVRCITRTTIGSNFLGESKAAGFQTDVGLITVVFFPAPDGAECVTTALSVSHGRYRYTFRTKQAGLMGQQVMVLDAPLHFLIQGRWFILVYPLTVDSLRLALLDLCEQQRQR